jgi:hypothetical protein
MTEIWITIAGFAFFVILYAIFSKIFPIISIWEVKEQEEEKSNNKESSVDKKYQEISGIDSTQL